MGFTGFGFCDIRNNQCKVAPESVIYTKNKKLNYLVHGSSLLSFLVNSARIFVVKSLKTRLGLIQGSICIHYNLVTERSHHVHCILYFYTIPGEITLPTKKILRIPRNSQKFKVQMKLDLEFLGIPRNSNLQASNSW